MNRLTILYGMLGYVAFLATSFYAVGFIGNFAVPKSMDSPADGPWQTALLIDLGLLLLFALQHSVMARPAFKRRWTRIVPESAERATYVLFSSLALILLFRLWQPMGGELWRVTSPSAVNFLYGLYACGWLLLLYVTFLINHFDLFGLRQVWLQLIGRRYTAVPFVTPWLYRQVRHPLYIGWFTVVWATPTMTVAHLVFAAMCTAYILFAIQLEEHDLIEAHPEYAEYRRRVPMLIPWLRKRPRNPGVVIGRGL